MCCLTRRASVQPSIHFCYFFVASCVTYSCERLNTVVRTLKDLERDDEQRARRRFEHWSWPDGPVCPFCNKTETVKVLNGKSMGEGWYHCRECRRKFTVRVGTILARSHIPLRKWNHCFSLFSEVGRTRHRLTATEVSQALQVTRKSARFMLRRIKKLRSGQNAFDRAVPKLR